MLNVLFDRLIDMAAIDVREAWRWPGSDIITLEDVINEQHHGVCGTPEPYGDIWKHPVKTERTKDYHIARIIYFLEHPEEISGIEVDNPCIDNGILPGCEIVDGYHRIAAGIILGLERVNIEYGGRGDVEDYITGKSDIRPEEILGV